MIVEIYKVNKEIYEIYEANLSEMTTSQFEINNDLWEEYFYLKSRMARIQNQIEDIINYQR